MKTIIQAMLEEVYINATNISREKSQVHPVSGEYFVTLAQLNDILKEFEG